MPLTWYRRLAASVDIGRSRGGIATGLRDAAVLALLGSGVGAVGVVALKASDLDIAHRGVGGVLIRQKPDEVGRQMAQVLDRDTSARLVAWIAAGGIDWGREVPVFPELTARAVYRLVWRAEREVAG